MTEDTVSRPTIDVERLAKALTKAARAVATEKRPDLHGRGWPSYTEWRNGHETTVTLLVSGLAEAIANEYDALEGTSCE